MDDILIEKEHYLKKQNSSLEGAGRVKHEASIAKLKRKSFNCGVACGHNILQGLN